MILKRHSKHISLARPESGNFHRNEWAIVGGQCADIKSLAGKIISEISPFYKCAYADTSHSGEKGVLPGRLANGSWLEYSDEINYSQLNYNEDLNKFKLRETFVGADLVLVNGNHYEANNQVVVIDLEKRASMQKRVEQLTNVQMILLADNTDDIFDFLKDAVPQWQDLPMYRINDIAKIAGFFKTQLEKIKPALNGLVLAGGKSVRMGFDKGAVNWHGKPQRYHMADLLTPICVEVFISCRAEQQEEIEPGYKNLPDTFTGLGPFGAILSAFREKPDNAWLVVACDLPLVDEQALRYLTTGRNASSIATAFQSTHKNFPEPLITIWEPKSYSVLLSFLAQGYCCPRKVLINNNVTMLDAPDPDDLTNVNTPDDLDKVKRLLTQKITAL